MNHEEVKLSRTHIELLDSSVEHVVSPAGIDSIGARSIAEGPCAEIRETAALLSLLSPSRYLHLMMSSPSVLPTVD